MTKECDILVQRIVGMVRQGIACRHSRTKLVFRKNGFIIFIVGFRLPIGKGDIDIVVVVLRFFFFPLDTANDNKVLDETSARVGLFVDLRQFGFLHFGDRAGAGFFDHGGGGGGVLCVVFLVV